MTFSIQLSADYPDKSYGGDRGYADMPDQAVLAGWLTLTPSRVAHLAHSVAERQRKIAAAYRYYTRFDNVFAGPAWPIAVWCANCRGCRAWTNWEKAC